MRLKIRSKKGFLVVASVLVALIMVTTTFTQVLGKSSEPEGYSNGKIRMGYVEMQGDLVAYNLDGVQIQDHGNPATVIDDVQVDADYQELITALEVKDAEGTSIIDPQFEVLRYNMVLYEPDVIMVPFDNDKLPVEQRGDQSGYTYINMVTFSIRTVNENDVHITFGYNPAMPDDERIVMGVVTNNDASIDAEGLEHQVFCLDCVVIRGCVPIYWRIWWYDSHHHPNWFYGWYFWYWRYYWYRHYVWYPWYTWWWGWYYWRYWCYWSCYWPYIW